MINRHQWPTEKLFDCILDTVFFIKNMGGQYEVVNDTFVKRCGYQNKNELIGKSPSETQGRSLGSGYEKQDQSILATGQPILNQLELHIYPNRSIGWCITNKFAVRDDKGNVIGIAGVSQDLKTPDKNHNNYAQLQSVIEYTERNLHLPPDVASLTVIAQLSAYQLDRRIRQIFGLPTGQWVLKQRLDLARKQLLTTNTSIADVAFNAGYKDQSAFSRQFYRATGFSPSAFRKTSEQ